MLIEIEQTSVPSGIQRVRSAFANSMDSIRGTQQIGSEYFYGSAGNRPSLAEMQARVNEYGSDAATLFRVSALLAQVVYLSTGEIPQILPPGIDYTINDDGTVTLTGDATDRVIVQPVMEVI